MQVGIFRCVLSSPNAIRIPAKQRLRALIRLNALLRENNVVEESFSLIGDDLFRDSISRH